MTSVTVGEILFVVWVIAVAFLCYLFTRWANALQRTNPLSQPQQPGVSVVICADRLFPSFEQLLKELEEQEYPSYEIIVVNDGPDAAVSAFLSRFGVHVREVQFDRQTKISSGKKEPLSEGISAASHPWVLLTDADCVVTKRWISTMMQSVRDEDTEIVLGYGPTIPGKDFLSLFARFDTVLIVMQYLSAAALGKPYMAVGRNLLYRKTLFTEADGFSLHLDLASGDDDLFIQQVASGKNTGVCTHPDSYAWSDPPPTWKAFFRQKRRHVSTSPHYALGSQLRISVFAIAWILTSLLPVALLLLFGLPMLVVVIVVTLVLWVLLERCARQLNEMKLMRWFPVLAPVYGLFLIILGILVTVGPGKKWK